MQFPSNSFQLVHGIMKYLHTACVKVIFHLRKMVKKKTFQFILIYIYDRGFMFVYIHFGKYCFISIQICRSVSLNGMFTFSESILYLRFDEHGHSGWALAFISVFFTFQHHFQNGISAVKFLYNMVQFVYASANEKFCILLQYNRNCLIITVLPDYSFDREDTMLFF